MSVEEAGTSSWEETCVFHFYPNVFVSGDSTFDSTFDTFDLLIQFISFNYFGFLESKCVTGWGF